MRRLSVLDVVTLDIGDDGRELDCRVRSVAGALARLVPLGPIPPEIGDTLTAGSFAYMIFTHRGSPVGLRGVVKACHEEEGFTLDFVVIDGIQESERRKRPRVPLIAAVKASALAVDGVAAETVVETVTLDLSVGGACLAGRPGLRDALCWRLELVLPGDSAPLRCDARLVKPGRTRVGVTFTSMEPADRARLGDAIADWQRCALLRSG